MYGSKISTKDFGYLAIYKEYFLKWNLSIVNNFKLNEINVGNWVSYHKKIPLFTLRVFLTESHKNSAFEIMGALIIKDKLRSHVDRY